MSFGLLDRISSLRARRLWARQAREAETLDLDKLRQLRGEAKGLRSHLDRVLFVADERLALPSVGSDHFRTPADTDWAWRPELWRGPLDVPGMASVENRTRLGPEMTVFHDCRLSELTVRQLRNQREEDLAPYGLRMDVFNFDGSFLSLVCDLPKEATQDITASHILRVECIIEMEKPLEIFARLNIKHGPNTEQIVRELPVNDSDVHAEFDLAYADLNEKRIEKAWVDLIFEGPEMNQVILRDLTFSRRTRASL